MGRPVAECRFRTQRADTAWCGLIEELTGIRQSNLSIVSLDACSACCESFLPSRQDPNPVVASLLYQACETTLEQRGSPELAVEKATELQLFAEKNLPAIQPGDDDIGLNEDIVPLDPADPIESVIPFPAVKSGEEVVRWCAGITTSPRRTSTLTTTIESVHRAGWERPRIFSDGIVEIPAEWCDLPVTVRNPRIGAWPSYYLALTEMLMREPNANAYVLFQDDIEILHRCDVREYLERLLWPGDVPGILSLYCSSAYTQETAGWQMFEGEWVWGATAFVFSAVAIKGLLASESVLRHRWEGAGHGLRGIDVAVGEWATETGTPIWFSTPSIVQHVGHVSTMWEQSRAVAERRASKVVRAAAQSHAPADENREGPFKFVLLSTGRCGSTLLQTALNEHSQIRVGGEPFCAATEHLQFRELIRTMYGREIDDETLSSDDRKLITNPDYVDSVLEQTDGILVHYWHLMPRLGPVAYYLLHRSEVRIIQLVRRNDFERYVSLQMARQTNVWHTRPDDADPQLQTIRVDPAEFIISTQQVADDILLYRDFFAGKIFQLHYEDLIADWDAALEKIQRVVNVPHERLPQRLKKTIHRPMNEIVENYEEVRQTCAGTSLAAYFNAAD